MRIALLFIAALMGVTTLYVNCSTDKNRSSEALADKLKNTVWERESQTCGTQTYIFTQLNTRISFFDGTYEIIEVLDSGCTIKRTGTWSSGGGVLSMSYSGVQCTPTTCSGIYKRNGEPLDYTCPDDVNSDGQNYAMSVDSTTLYLTPTLGSDLNCYYKFIRK